eukprot:SAG11_NODE_451_length_9386_cov_42.557661_3_plen_64_part_00
MSTCDLLRATQSMRPSRCALAATHDDICRFSSPEPNQGQTVEKLDKSNANCPYSFLGADTAWR